MPVAWVGGRPARLDRAAEAGARQVAARGEAGKPAIATGSRGPLAQGHAHKQAFREANPAGQLPGHQRHRQRRGAAGRRGQSRWVFLRRCLATEQPGGAYVIVSRSDRFFAFRGPLGGRRCEPRRRAQSGAPRAAAEAGQGPGWGGNRTRPTSVYGGASPVREERSDKRQSVFRQQLVGGCAKTLGSPPDWPAVSTMGW